LKNKKKEDRRALFLEERKKIGKRKEMTISRKPFINRYHTPH
jgi:hypothetical protein